MTAGVSGTYPSWAWAVFGGLVLGLLVFDLFVLHRKAREVPFREAVWLTAFWIAVSLGFGGFIWVVAGGEAAGAYLTAYLIEKSLSLDNVFVFAVIFASFGVPKQYRYHVLFYGVLGAIVFRLIFVLLGTALLSTFSWLVLIFGAFLVFTGIRMLTGSPEPVDPEGNKALRLLRRRLPMTDGYRGDSFVVRHGRKLCATPLLAVLVVIESSDIIFAIDSVPAVLSVTRNTFVAYAAIVFAVLGLRALYFTLEGLIDRFVYLHYGLAAILIFLGAEFVLEGFEIHLPILVTLLFIATVIVASVVGSLVATRVSSRGGETVDARSVEDAGEDGRPTVLVATDGSEAALHAGQHATLLAERLHAKLLILAVVDTGEAFRTGVHYGEGVAWLERRCSEATGRIAAFAAAAGVDHEERAVRGEPARAIVAAADTAQAHYVLMGADGMSRLGRAIVGSVSQAVLRHADGPVVLLVGGERPPVPPPSSPVEGAEDAVGADRRDKHAPRFRRITRRKRAR